MWETVVNAFCLSPGRQVHSLSLIHRAGHPAKGDQVCQAGPAFHKPPLTPSPPDMLCHDDEHDLLQDLPCLRGQADRPIFSESYF